MSRSQEPNNTAKSIAMSVSLHGFVWLMFIFGGYLQLFSETKKNEDQVFIMVPDSIDIPRTPDVEPTIARLSPVDMQPIKPLDNLPPPPAPPTPAPPTPPPPAPPKTVSIADFRRQNPDRRNANAVRPNRALDPNAVLLDAPSLNIREGATTQIPPTPSLDEISRYKALVAAKAQSSWMAPAEFNGQTLSASVRIEIAANGRVSSFRLVKSSRQPAYDRAIEELLKMITFPPPPRGRAFVININFNSDNAR